MMGERCGRTVWENCVGERCENGVGERCYRWEIEKGLGENTQGRFHPFTPPQGRLQPLTPPPSVHTSQFEKRNTVVRVYQEQETVY